jgi:hypothetical protein
MRPLSPDKRREANLRCALGLLRLTSSEPELTLLHRWLDSWSGIGLVALGMYRQGYRLSLSHIAEGEWRASFGTNTMFAPSGYGVAASAMASGAGCGVVSGQDGEGIVTSSAAVSVSGDFILEVRVLYLLGRGEAQKSQQVPRRTRTSHAVSAYILAVAAVEASLNEIFLSESSVMWLGEGTVIHELREQLEYLDLIPKLLILCQLALGKRLSTGQQPIQDMKMLVQLRHALTHYKMSGKVPNFISDLAQRGIATRLPSGEGEVVSPWVPRVSTMEGIAWAHRTACRTVRAVVALFPEDKQQFLGAYSMNFAESEERLYQ